MAVALKLFQLIDPSLVSHLPTDKHALKVSLGFRADAGLVPKTLGYARVMVRVTVTVLGNSILCMCASRILCLCARVRVRACVFRVALRITCRA